MRRKVFCCSMVILCLFLSSCFDKHDDTIKATGTVEALTDVNVASKVAEQVMEMFVDEGYVVKAGDPIATIDNTLLQLKHEEALAAVKLAEARLDLLLVGAREEDIKQAEELVKESKANLKIAQLDHDRILNLYADGSTTEQERDKAVAAYTVAKAKKSSALQELKKMEHWARPEEIREAKAQVAQAKAAAALLQQRLDDCNVVAPVSGVVTYKPTNTGEFVGVGTTLVTISQIEKVKIFVYLPEGQVGKLKLGQKAAVTSDAYPNESFDGKIIFIATTAEFTPKNTETQEQRVKLVFGVKVELENPKDIFKPGLPATVSF